MNITNFARIRNAKALLLTPDKRVLHFPAEGKVRIDNILPDNLSYRDAAQRASVKEYTNANTAALKTGLVPPVQNYRERGNMTSYTQDYAGKPLPNRLKGIEPKEQYKLGSQVGRIQNRLREQNLGHVDIHEGNVVRPNPKRREVKLIDNASIENIKDKYDEAEVKNLYAAKRLGKPFMTGYNSRINFTQQKQMQHFANFGIEQILNQSKTYGKQGLDYINRHPVRSAAGITAAAGALKGSGVFETEEEKANTTGLGRLGKIVTNSALGATIGTGGMVINQKASQLGAQAAQKYKRGVTPDPDANPARQAGQVPTPIP
jgi:hypothetical protein